MRNLFLLLVLMASIACQDSIVDVDDDGDGYGRCDVYVQEKGDELPDFCVPDDDEESDYRASVHDCDDSDPNIYPGAPEIPCDQIDQDCDADRLADEWDPADGPAPPEFDCDGDGFILLQGGGEESDCQPFDFVINPDALDSSADPDGIDNDCDGLIDGQGELNPLEDSYPVTGCTCNVSLHGMNTFHGFFSFLLFTLIFSRRREYRVCR